MLKIKDKQIAKLEAKLAESEKSKEINIKERDKICLEMATDYNRQIIDLQSQLAITEKALELAGETIKQMCGKPLWIGGNIPSPEPKDSKYFKDIAKEMLRMSKVMRTHTGITEWNGDFWCDSCGKLVRGITTVNGMDFCAKCYQETFGETEKDRKIIDLQSQLAEKEKEIERLNACVDFYKSYYISFREKVIDELERVKEKILPEISSYVKKEFVVKEFDNQIKKLKEMR